MTRQESTGRLYNSEILSQIFNITEVILPPPLRRLDQTDKGKFRLHKPLTTPRTRKVGGQ